MTTRRRLLFAGALGALAPAWSLAQPRAVRIGVLGPRPVTESYYAGHIVRRLGELGYRDIEYRSANGVAERYPKLARELIGLKCDLIVAYGDRFPVRAVQDERSQVPLVFLAVDYDPVDAGLVASLRRPDRNTTGVYVPYKEMLAKRMQIMLEVVPNARRILVFADIFSKDQISAARKTADSLGVALLLTEFAGQPYDIQGAFAAGLKAGAQAYVQIASPVIATHSRTLAALALRNRLPSVGSVVEEAEAGFLISYSSDPAKAARRTAEIAVRVVKGNSTADIPVEQADEFVLAVNSTTARALGIKVPESVLARATRIVS